MPQSNHPTIKLRHLLALAFTAILLALVMVETTLRLIGFRYSLYPQKIEFGWPNPQTIENRYLPDDQLLWAQKDYHQKVEELKNSPPDILFLGDSCTEFGTYDKFFADRLAADNHLNLKVAKIGAGGWTSYQGLQAMRRDISQIKPRITTIYFGWNDHWIGFGIEDKEIGRLRSPLFSLLERFRTAQLVVQNYVRFSQNERNKYPLRVSESDFQANLRNIVKSARAKGIVPVLLTAPTSHQLGHEPQYLKKRHLKDLSQLVPLHQRYVEIVRETAHSENSVLCDLAKDFSAIPQADLVNKYFYTDGIHLTKEPNQGYDLLSGFLYECLKRENLL